MVRSELKPEVVLSTIVRHLAGSMCQHHSTGSEECMLVKSQLGAQTYSLFSRCVECMADEASPIRRCRSGYHLPDDDESRRRKFMDKLLENDAFNVLVEVSVNTQAPQGHRSLL